MIKLFNPVVSLIAIISVRTFLMVFNVPAFLRLVEAQGSSPVFLIVVVVRAFFEIMT